MVVQAKKKRDDSGALDSSESFAEVEANVHDSFRTVIYVCIDRWKATQRN